MTDIQQQATGQSATHDQDVFVPVSGAPYKYDYNDVFRSIASGKVPKNRTYRELCKKDLFFVLHFGLNRKDTNDSFVVRAIREVEADHDDTMDLWAREHYKSTIITLGLPIQELILDPDERIAIFSHTRPIAKDFLRDIKLILEGNVPVKHWFPDVFWPRPKTQAPKWSEDDGLIMKRSIYAKESSIEAWGLVDGMPTGKHFSVRIYDDVVTKESVTTPEQIRKNKDAFELSESLGTRTGTRRIAGTYYHFNDTYSQIKTHMPPEKVREKPATQNGDPHGELVFLSQDRWEEIKRTQSSHFIACQYLLDPRAAQAQTFKTEWLTYYEKPPARMNKYLLVDPANSKKETADYTVMVVIGIDPFDNRLLLDGLRDRLSLAERWAALRHMVQDHPDIRACGYESYGMQADISYIEEQKKKEGLYFPIQDLHGKDSKWNRINLLEPQFRNHRFLLPSRQILYRTVEGEIRDFTRDFIDEEYIFAPFCPHDDMLDCMARVEDPHLGAIAPSVGGAAKSPEVKDLNVLERMATAQ